MLKLFKSKEIKNKRNCIILNLQEDKKFSEDPNRLINLLEKEQNSDRNNIKLSIKEYVSKIRKQLLLIEKLKQSNPNKKIFKFQNKIINSEKSLLSSRSSIRSSKH